MALQMNRGRDKYNKYRKFLIASSVLIKIFPLSIRISLFSHLRNTSGIKGIAMRYILLRSIVRKCGDNVSIHQNVYFFNTCRLSLGSNVSIHPMCYFDASGDIEIGDDVSIAHGVSILSSTHNFNNCDRPIKDQGVTTMKTVIHDNVWIGAKSTILSGVIINTGSIVGANSLVTKEVEKNSVVGGVPAKLLKYRTLDNI